MIFSAEWTYLLTTRKVGDEDSAFSFVRIKYGENATDTVTGTIIYPDDFSFSEAGVASIKFGKDYLTEINVADWEALESVGCVFLPSCRAFNYTSDGQLTLNEAIGSQAWYWTASANDAGKAKNVQWTVLLSMRSADIEQQRNFGYSVRLVQDY